MPLLVTVTACSADCWPTSVSAKAKVEDDKDTAGTPTPFPVSAAVTGAEAPVQVTEMLPERVPVAAGEKVRLAAHEVPTARLVPQVLVTA